MTEETPPAPGGLGAIEPFPIAIVGIGCRYADARGPAEFWEIVKSGRNTVRDVPQHRVDLGYDIDHFYDPRPRIPGKISSKKGGFLEHPELFDAAAFGIAPRDALTMEPQQRLMVEVTWDALEDAGIVPASLAGERVAVILGYMAEDYSRERLGVLGEEAVFRGYDVFTVGGMSHAVLSGKVAYLLGVTGPSFTLDTACSSSLIATHLACESLRHGESKLAIAGGVNVFLAPEGNIALSRSGMLSMSGACKAFDASADGFVRAEGAGVVVLQPLADAVASGNPIYAVIRGSGISSDGRDGGHMMAPGRKGQAQAMRDAYARAGVSPADVQYVETHGTGTLIGDPVEIGALADVMGPGRPADRPLRVASVKGNLGHTESASGVAGLIKAALMMKKREMPAQLHFETPNPAIPWDDIPIRVQSETTPWPHPGPALVGVNSFGISGTNAHLVLESAPEPVPAARAAQSPGPSILPITAHEPQALQQMAERTSAQLGSLPESEFADLTYTLTRRRAHRALRLAVVADSAAEARRELDAYLDGRASASLRSGVAPADAAPRVVMVFPGQGGQWLGMGRELLRGDATFAASIDRIDAAFRSHVDWSLRACLEGSADGDWTARLDMLQPILVAMEIALAELWMSRGVRPARVVGQSMGEIAAAYVAGALDIDDVALLACHRGMLVARAAGRGAMAVVALSRERVSEELAGRRGVEIAGTTAPTTTIVSGDADAVREVVAELDARNVFARLLDVDFASHCAHMDPLIDPFRQRLAGFAAGPTHIPFDSTVDGCEKAGEQLDVDYWLRNLREPVAFDLGLKSAIEGGGEIFLEVSPHPTLRRAIEEIATASGRSVACIATLAREQDEQRSLANSLAELFVRGVPIDFEALAPAGRVIETPLYALQPVRYWFSERNRSHRFRPVHPLLGAVSQSSLDPRLYSWDTTLDADTGSFAAGYRSAGVPFAPAALVAEFAFACAEATWPGVAVELTQLDWRRALSLGASGRRRLQAVVRVDGPGRGELRLSSRTHDADAWTLHATCRLRPDGSRASDAARNASSKDPSLDRTGNTPLATDRHFSALERCEIAVDAKCRVLRELETDAQSAGLVAHLMLPRAIESEWHAYHSHPALLETALQLAGCLGESDSAVQPSSVARFALTGGLGSECWCRVTARPAEPAGRPSFDLAFFDRELRPLGCLEGLEVEALPAGTRPKAPNSLELCELRWVDAEPQAAAVETQVDRWIIVSDSVEEASNLASELRKEGACGHFCEKIEDLPALAEQLRLENRSSWGLALLAWGAARTEPLAHRKFRIASWAAAIREHCSDAVQVWIATRGLVAVDASDRPDAEAARLLAREVEAFSNCAEMQPCRLFDASAELRHAERLSLARWMGRDQADRQFAARGSSVRVPRLVERAPLGATAATPALRDAGERNVRALHAGRRDFGGLEWSAASDPVAAHDGVVVEVHASALTQLDVLTALGLSRRGRAGLEIGFDFAGIVREVGESQQRFAVGDEVFGLHAGALQRRIAVAETHLCWVPNGLDLVQAASLPLPFLTARYALEEVARLRAGERLLVGSAGGGVGQALVQLGLSLGAQVSATATSGPRRDALRELGARLCDPAADDGEYDVIVSAASGAALHALLERLVPGGRYVDLCPRRGFERAAPGALQLGPNQSLASIDVPELVRSAPHLAASLLARTARDANQRHIRPIATTLFPADQAHRALRFMTQNRHVGRVCIDLSGAEQLLVDVTPDEPVGASSGCRVAIGGNQPALQSALWNWLQARGAEVVADLAHAPSAAHADQDGWLQVRGQRGAKAQPVEARVSVRRAVGASEGADRAWETRAWLDRLQLSSRDADAKSLALCVGADCDPARVAELVGSALLSDDPASQLFTLDARELAERQRQAPSPWLADLSAPDAASGSSLRTRGEILAMTPPERRNALHELVVFALAAVLSLSEEQRSAVDLASGLDSLGLDSLMTLELFVGLGRDLDLELQADWFGTAPTLAQVAQVLQTRLEAAAASASS